MSNKSDSRANSLIAVGVFNKVHGILGEISFTPYNKIDTCVFNIKSWFIKTSTGKKEYQLAYHKKAHKKELVKIEMIDSKEQAAALVNKEVFVRKSALKVLDQNAFYFFELKNMDVYSKENVFLGKVEKIEQMPASPILYINTTNIKNYSENILLIPAIFKEFIESIDRNKNCIKLTKKLVELY